MRLNWYFTKFRRRSRRRREVHLMNISTRLWLWAALILIAAAVFLNAVSGRWLSAGAALLALAGLCSLLFLGKKSGFLLLCVFSACFCAAGIVSSISGGFHPVPAVTVSLAGSALIPCVTLLLLRGQWEKLT